MVTIFLEVQLEETIFNADEGSKFSGMPSSFLSDRLSELWSSIVMIRRDRGDIYFCSVQGTVKFICFCIYYQDN